MGIDSKYTHSLMLRSQARLVEKIAQRAAQIQPGIDAVTLARKAHPEECEGFHKWVAAITLVLFDLGGCQNYGPFRVP